MTIQSDIIADVITPLYNNTLIDGTTAVSVTVTAPGKGTWDTTIGGFPETPVATAAQALQRPFTDREVADGAGLFERGDIELTIQFLATGGVSSMTTEDRITLNSRIYKIINIEEIRMLDTVTGFKCQCS